jgi:hypothetical protein
MIIGFSHICFLSLFSVRSWLKAQLTATERRRANNITVNKIWRVLEAIATMFRIRDSGQLAGATPHRCRLRLAVPMSPELRDAILTCG